MLRHRLERLFAKRDYFLNRERYRNILLLFPTIALLNENTESVNQLIQELKLEYKIINNVYSGIEDTEKHILF